MRRELLSSVLTLTILSPVLEWAGCAAPPSPAVTAPKGTHESPRRAADAAPAPRAGSVVRVDGIGALGMVSDIRWVKGVEPGWLVAGVAGVAPLDGRGRLIRSAPLNRPGGSWTSTLMIATVDGRPLLLPLVRAGSSFNGIDVFAEDGSLAARFEPFGPDTTPFEYTAAVMAEESSGRCWCVGNREKCALIDLRSMKVARLMDWPKVNSGATPIFEGERLVGIATASGRFCVMMSPDGVELWRKAIPGKYVQWVRRGVVGGRDVLEFASTRRGQTTGRGELWVLALDRPDAEPRRLETDEVVETDDRDSSRLSGRPRRSGIEVVSDPPELGHDGRLRLRDRASGVEWLIPSGPEDLHGPGVGHAVLRGGDLTLAVHRGSEGVQVLVGYGSGLFLCTER